MSLRELLQELVQTAGALGAVIIDRDGITVDECMGDGQLDLQSIAIEYVAAIRETHQAVALLDSGEFEGMTVTTEHLTILIRSLMDGLYLLLAQENSSFPGRTGYLLRRDLHKFRELLQ